MGDSPAAGGAMPMKFPNISWWVEVLALGLNPGERETVLGDLEEAGETGRRAFWSVAGLLIWRQLTLLRSWRPWVAGLGLAMPASFLLMGFSVSIAQSYVSVIGGTVIQITGIKVAPGLTMLLCDAALLAAWSASGAFAVGVISPRTTWMSATTSLLACVFCLARFRMNSLSPLCLLLFLPPALAGFSFGLRSFRMPLSTSLAVAFITTALTTPHWNKAGAPLPVWVLSWPTWYLVVTAWRRRAQLRSGLQGGCSVVNGARRHEKSWTKLNW